MIWGFFLFDQRKSLHSEDQKYLWFPRFLKKGEEDLAVL